MIHPPELRVCYDIDSLDDPRLSPYRLLKDRELAREGERFIAEGEHVVHRLLQSHYPVESVLLAERRAAEMGPVVGERAPIYVVQNQLIHQILGFKFHSGVIACGRRLASPTLNEAIPSHGRVTVVVCPETNNTENLGALIRVAAGFGVTAMLLGPRCADPFYRQSIRVSMGTVFHLPIVQSSDLDRDLKSLKQSGVELVATVTDSDAQSLATAGRPDRLALLFGNEAQGLGQQWTRLCHRKVTIPMQLGTDSLNVHVAAAVMLYRFTQEL